jgi:hypothetical protein
MKYFIALFCGIAIFLSAHSQKFTIIKGKGEFNPSTNFITYLNTEVLLNGNNWKLVCRGKGKGKCPDLKEYSLKMFNLYQTGEKIIANSLSRKITSNDTVVDGYRYVWHGAEFLKKGKIRGLSYKLTITKVRRMGLFRKKKNKFANE